VIEKLAAEAQGRWELVKVNTEENEELAMVFDIRSIPCVKLFHRGEVADQFVGALPEPEIRRWLAKALPSPNAGKLAEARQMASRGEFAPAVAALEPLVEEEPRNDEARLLLAECLLAVDPSRIPVILDGVEPHSDHAERAEALRTLGALAMLADGAASAPERPAGAGYVEAAKAIRRGDFDTALEALIELMGKKGSQDKALAKQACKAVFQMLGPRHAVVEKHFRAFSSAVHS
jgi:putative thioredoxin